MRIRSAMLMAAGLGTRLRPFTDRLPKPLLPLMGVPMAQFTVDSLARAGVRHIVANVHHLAAEARSGLQALDLGGARLEISDESSQLLGSAGGLRKAQELLGNEPFFYVNGDVLTDVSLSALALRHEHLRAQWGVSVTLALLPRAEGPGKYKEVLVDAAGERVTGLGDVVSGRPFFIGSAVIEPEALAEIPREGPADFVPSILSQAIARGTAGVFLAEGSWSDIGSPELWLDAHLSLLAKMETGRLHADWRRRISAASVRLAEQVWMARGSREPRLRAEWAGPAYWGGGGKAPRVLGPGAVLYGAGPVEAGSGIGFGGSWVSTRRG